MVSQKRKGAFCADRCHAADVWADNYFFQVMDDRLIIETIAWNGPDISFDAGHRFWEWADPKNNSIENKGLYLPVWNRVGVGGIPFTRWSLSAVILLTQQTDSHKYATPPIHS